MFSFFKKQNQEVKSEVPKRFFSVAISEKIVQAALWETEQTVRVLTKSELKPYFNENDLLVKLDGCLQELGPEGEVVHKTLFHLDSSFVIGQEIRSEKKELFQKITESLQLESLGFVTNMEAVVNAKLEQNPSLKKQLVVEFTSDKVTYGLYDGKTLMDSFEVASQPDFGGQFHGALVQLAGQLGEDYSGYFREKKELEPGEKEASPLFANFISGLISSSEIQEKVDKLPAELPMRPDTLGNDILLTFILIPSATIIAKSYGWLSEPQEEVTGEINTASTPPAVPVAVAEAVPVLSRQKNFTPPKIEKNEFVPTPKVKKELTAEEKAKQKKSNKMIVVVAVVLAVAGLVMAGFWWLVNQASVTVSLVPKQSSISKNLEVVVDPKATTADYEALVLPGQIITKEVMHEMTFTTTGKKEIGEKAQGKVEISNKRTEKIDLKQGTILEDGVHQFSLNNDITLDPATEDGDGKKYSKKEANVTAVDPGTAGNIKKDVSLRVGSRVKEDLEARSMEDFAGGTEKIAKVFSADDEKSALVQAEEELAVDVREQIGNRDGDTYLAVQIDQLKTKTTQFDTKVGEEADGVMLTMTATVPVVAYKLDELKPLSQAALEKELPAGYVFTQTEMSSLSEVNDKKTADGNGNIYIDVDLTQEIRSVLDLEAIKAQILGEELKKVDNYLKSQPEIKSYEIVWGNSLTPRLSGKLPKKAEKVILEEKSQE